MAKCRNGQKKEWGKKPRTYPYLNWRTKLETDTLGLAVKRQRSEKDTHHDGVDGDWRHTTQSKIYIKQLNTQVPTSVMEVGQQKLT
jgi:hypothetical protein